MPTVFCSAFLTTALGLVALIGLPGSANADEGNEYRIIGCSAQEPPVPPFDPTYVVRFSSSPADVGQTCEAVLTSLGLQGFRLIEVRSDNVFDAGNLHYLERRSDD